RIFDGIQAVEAHNNVLYASAGGTIRVERTVEAVWTDGRQVGGSNNWVPADATFVPPEWTGTLQGGTPGFADVAQLELAPGPDSDLADAANPAPQPIPGYAVPGTTFPPVYQRRSEGDAPVGATPRADSGPLDIGAIKRAGVAIFADGFED